MDIAPATIVEALPAGTENGWQVLRTWRFDPDSADDPWTDPDQYRDRTLGSANAVNDHGGNLIKGFTTLQGNTSQLVLERVGPSGPKATIEVPPTNFKAEVGGMQIKQSGTGLLLAIVAHEAIADPTRLNIYAVKLLPDWCVYDPARALEDAHPVDPSVLQPSPPPNPDPGPPGLTKADVVVAAEEALEAGLGAGKIEDVFKQMQKAAENAVIDALATHLPPVLITVANMGAAYANSPQVQQQLDNRIGLQLWKFGLLSGLVPDAKLPAWVKNPATGYPWPNG